MKANLSFSLRSLTLLLGLVITLLGSATTTCLASSAHPVHFTRELLGIPLAGEVLDSAALDLNGDGNLDLAVLDDDGLFILLGDGTGHFSPWAEYNQGGFQAALAFGDFNGDAFPDAVVANFPGINVLLNDGAGGFPTSTFINTGAEPSGLARADFNGDGKLDLAVSDFQANSISILLGDGNGGFAAPIILPTGTSPAGLVALDFDGDGVPDLAVTEYGSMDLRIFKGTGDGHFTAGAIYPLGGNSNALVKADFNHDGKTDLAVGVFNSNTQIAVFLGNGDGTFTQSASVFGATGLYGGLEAANINGDGRPDVVSILGFALGNGDGTFRPVVNLPLPHSRIINYALSTGDFNNDGRDDIFTAASTGVLYLSIP